jgi:hypothetical protein
MMIALIAAALVAAQPATVPATPPAQQMPAMQVDAGQAHEQHSQMAEMKDCCCHDMTTKMEGHGAQPQGHPAGHDGHQGQ